jgi:hypothetical protein
MVCSASGVAALQSRSICVVAPVFTRPQITWHAAALAALVVVLYSDTDHVTLA